MVSRVMIFHKIVGVLRTYPAFNVGARETMHSDSGIIQFELQLWSHGVASSSGHGLRMTMMCSTPARRLYPAP